MFISVRVWACASECVCGHFLEVKKERSTNDFHFLKVRKVANTAALPGNSNAVPNFNEVFSP